MAKHIKLLNSRSLARNPPRNRKSIRQKALALMLGCLAACCILEAFCRFWNPFALRVKGGRFALPANERKVIENHRVEKLDRSIVPTRNAIGLRGDNPPADFDRWLSIIAVGGSTTECYYLSDDKTWPEQLRRRIDEKFARVWVNNAGLDGHSTFGHQFFLENYLAPLRPKVILYLVGINDVGNDEWTPFELMIPRILEPGAGAWRHAWQGLTESSAAFATLDAALRSREAKRRGLVHADIDHQQLVLAEGKGVDIPQAARAEIIGRHRRKFLPHYEGRLRQLLQATRGYQIEPILVTQPALYGPAIDDLTKVNLGRMEVGDSIGEVQWEILELYNDVTREVGRDESVPVIELARRMPKSSRYYYDHLHFTNQGADWVASLVFDELAHWLAKRFPAHVRGGADRL